VRADTPSSGATIRTIKLRLHWRTEQFHSLQFGRARIKGIEWIDLAFLRITGV